MVACAHVGEGRGDALLHGERALGDDGGEPDVPAAWEQGQRCLIPAIGFYEWQDAGERTKQPWSIEPLNDEFFMLDGWWETSCGADDIAVLSFTIVTVPANSLIAESHNAEKKKHCMPLSFGAEERAAWLSGSLDEAAALIEPTSPTR